MILPFLFILLYLVYGTYEMEKKKISNRMKYKTVSKEINSFHFSSFRVVATHDQPDKMY